MSAGFGFSAGDFIAALKLVSTVVDALRDSGDSSAEFRELVSQLLTLETALLNVKRLELDDAQHAEIVALQQAAAQCQRTIDAFWEKIKKYQTSLRTAGSRSRVRDGWRKVKWALLKKEDLLRFKTDLMGHTQSIEMLLMTVQMATARLDSKRNNQSHQTLAGRVQDSYFGCMQRISLVLERVSTGIQQGKQLLDMTAKVIQTNVQIFQIVLNLQNIITRIPGQVNRQQPVYFVDALCRHMPFHLEFILSAEALTSVLRSNFKNVGSGAKKIENGEFVIQDAATKVDVDLGLPWETCFAPGQHAAMSMVFTSTKTTTLQCPNCHDENGDSAAQDEDIDCQKCKMVYRRSVSLLASSSRLLALSTAYDSSYGTVDPLPKSTPSPSPLKRNKPHDDEDEIVLFRRVRIKAEIRIPAVMTPPRSSPGEGRNDPMNPSSSIKQRSDMDTDRDMLSRLDRKFNKGTDIDRDMLSRLDRKPEEVKQTPDRPLDNDDSYPDPLFLKLTTARNAIDDQVKDIFGDEHDYEMAEADVEDELALEDKMRARRPMEIDLEEELLEEARVGEALNRRFLEEKKSDTEEKKSDTEESESEVDSDEDMNTDMLH